MEKSTPKETPAFVCRHCSACCRIPGYVRIDDAEIQQIAAYLEMPVEQFLEFCTVPTADRPGYSLAENPDGACMFLRPDGRCDINPVKPRQCRDFPLAWAVPDAREFCAGLAKSISGV